MRLAIAAAFLVGVLSTGLAAADSVPATGKSDPYAGYHAILKREADRMQVPLDIADAVVTIESGYDPTKIGSVGEIGLMQVRPETAAMMGFKGTRLELAKPDVNLFYGVRYLAGAWQRSAGDLCRALMKYRAGHGETIMSALSAAYCARAQAHLLAMGSPYATGLHLSFPAASRSTSASAVASRLMRVPRIRTAATSAAFWAAKMAHVRSMSARIEKTWRRMASK